MAAAAPLHSPCNTATCSGNSAERKLHEGQQSNSLGSNGMPPAFLKPRSALCWWTRFVQRGSQGCTGEPDSALPVQCIWLARQIEESSFRRRGINPTLLGILPYAGLKFYIYQSMKQYYWQLKGHPRAAGQHQKQNQRLPIWLMLSFGGVSGVVAQTITYPLDVVRRHMQVVTWSILYLSC